MPTRAGETSAELDRVGFADTPVEYVRTLFINFLKMVHAGQPVGEYHWSEGEETEIWISGESPVNGAVVGKKPALTVTRGPMSMFSNAIDAMKSTDFATGSKVREVLVPGNMSVNCISNVPLEAERIAFWLSGQFLAHRNLLVRQPGMFDVGLNSQVSAPSPAGSLVTNDGGKGSYVVVLTLPFTFIWNQKMTPLGKRIAAEVLVRAAHRFGFVTQTSAWTGFTHEVPLSTCEHGPEPFADASDARGKSPDPSGLRETHMPRQDSALDPARTTQILVVRPPPTRTPSRDQYVPFANRCVEESTTQLLGTSEIKVR